MRASKPVSSIQLARPPEKDSLFKIKPHFLTLKKANKSATQRRVLSFFEFSTSLQLCKFRARLQMFRDKSLQSSILLFSLYRYKIKTFRDVCMHPDSQFIDLHLVCIRETNKTFDHEDQPPFSLQSLMKLSSPGFCLREDARLSENFA